MEKFNQPILILAIEGALQSWGIRSRWDFRDSGLEPSKSGIVGLIGCALGIPRNDPQLEDLDRNLKMGVREERSGTLIQDFHTISMDNLMANRKGKGASNTIVSRREYIQDAAYTVFIQSSGEILKKISKALQNPKWPFYLGRKSCIPSRPPFISISYDYKNLKDALEHYERVFSERQPFHKIKDKLNSLKEKVRIIFDDEKGNITRQDLMRVGESHMYDFRKISIDFIDLPNIAREKEVN